MENKVVRLDKVRKKEKRLNSATVKKVNQAALDSASSLGIVTSNVDQVQLAIEIVGACLPDIRDMLQELKEHNGNIVNWTGDAA